MTALGESNTPAVVSAAIARAGLNFTPGLANSNLLAPLVGAEASQSPTPVGDIATMPSLTIHTAAPTAIDGTPYLALRRTAHDPRTGEFKRNMSGGLWVNLSPERADAEIVRDLTDAAQAAIAFAQLAAAEIAARTQATTKAA